MASLGLKTIKLDKAIENVRRAGNMVSRGKDGCQPIFQEGSELEDTEVKCKLTPLKAKERIGDTKGVWWPSGLAGELKRCLG